MILRLHRLLLLAGMALASINLFTGAPLLAIWLGSRVQGDAGGLTMTAVLVVVVAMAVLCAGLVSALNRMGAAHDRAAGRPAGRRRSPWLKSFNEGAAGTQGEGIRALDAVLVAAVVLAVLAFEVWFFFFAGASI